MSCADGVTVAHTFTTNDCTDHEVQTAPATGECLEASSSYSTVECGADGVTQKVYADADCSGEPIDTITAAFGECQNPTDGYSSKAVSCANGDTVVVYHTFTTNDCTDHEVQTAPATGECCDSEDGCSPSPPLSPPAPPGTEALGLLIGVIAGSIGGCLLLTLCIALVVVCCCCRKGKNGKRRTTLGTQARHQEYAVDVNGKTAV